MWVSLLPSSICSNCSAMSEYRPQNAWSVATSVTASKCSLTMVLSCIWPLR